MSIRLRLTIATALAAPAACLVCAAVFSTLGPALAEGANITTKIAQAGLPNGSRVNSPLRRGHNGEIENIDPTTEKGTGSRRCRAGTICVGKEETYRKLLDALEVARPGMTIEITGDTFRETVAVRTRDITIRGAPRIDCTGLRLTGDKACILLAADGITLENLDISGAVLPEAAGANGAASATSRI